MISVDNISFAYRRAFELRIKSFELLAGQRVLLVGPSGAGKTTFLMLLRGILLPQTGRLTVMGHDFSQMNEAQRRRFRLTRVGSVFQQPTLLPYLSVADNLNLNRLLGHTALGEASEHELVKRFGLQALLKRFPKELSGGEVQRVSLVRPFLHEPELLIADEPTNHLDQDHKEIFVELLNEYQTPKRSTLIVSHDEGLKRHCDLVIDFREIAA